jgi:hypothetical protein
MSRWDDGWKSADVDAHAEMGEEVTVDGVVVKGVVTGREGGGAMQRGGMTQGQSALLHVSAAVLATVTIADGSKVKLADGTVLKVVAERGASGSGKAFVLEGKWAG